MVVILAIGILGMILILMLMLKAPANVNNHLRNNSIDTKRLEEIILPNNKGRSIDDVIKNMKKNDITPEFHLVYKDK